MELGGKKKKSIYRLFSLRFPGQTHPSHLPVLPSLPESKENPFSCSLEVLLAPLEYKEQASPCASPGFTKSIFVLGVSAGLHDGVYTELGGGGGVGVGGKPSRRKKYPHILIRDMACSKTSPESLGWQKSKLILPWGGFLSLRPPPFRLTKFKPQWFGILTAVLRIMIQMRLFKRVKDFKTDNCPHTLQLHPENCC